MMLKKITIIGLGLIGGSIAKALKKIPFAETVVAFDNNQNILQQAQDEKIIDHAEFSLQPAIANADLIVLALPPQACIGLLNDLETLLTTTSVITDVCSVKEKIIASAKIKLGNCFSHFVPGHPIAGSENSGYLASREDLFAGRHVILTPDEQTHRAALSLVTNFWQQLGCQIHIMAASKHDAYLARTSHLPQLTAYALINVLQNGPHFPHILEFIGTGFKDTTRLAASNPELWSEIAMLNNKEISTALQELLQQIQQIQNLLHNNDMEALNVLLKEAQKTRRGI